MDDCDIASDDPRRDDLVGKDNAPVVAGESVDGPGRPCATEAVSSSSSDSDSDRDEESSSLIRVAGGGMAHTNRRALESVTLLNFGTVNLEGTTHGVEVGHKTQYIGPVTVQQIIHSGLTAKPTSLRNRELASSREPGPVASEGTPRRTVSVIRGSSEGSGHGDSSRNNGNSQSWKHLPGRQFRIVHWLLISLLSLFTWIAMIIYSFIFARFHRVEDLEIPSSHNLFQPREYAESPQVLQRLQNRGEIGEWGHEAFPNLHQSVIISRSAWLANPPKEYTPLEHPVEYVIISHTATEPCDNEEECSIQVRVVQRFHVESRKWSDIGYNFLVGGDGNSYEGRGWEYVGAHAKGYNAVSIGISFIGTFSNVLPPPAQIRACKLLINKGVSLGKISPNYKLIGHRQVSPTESPGEKLYENLQTWDHWSPEV